MHVNGGCVTIQRQGVHWYLTDDEVRFVRGQLEALRPKVAYDPGRSFVSALNFKPEVLSFALPPRMPERVMIRDITLRTAEQVTGVALGLEERKRLARALVEAGVGSLQLTLVGWNVPAQAIKDEIKYIKSINPDVQVVAGGVDTEAGLDKLLALGIDMPSVSLPAIYGIAPFYVGNTPRRAWDGENWRKDMNFAVPSLAEAMAPKQRILRIAKKRGIPMEAKLNMLLYATPEAIREYCSGMAEAGADYITLADGPSAMSPNAIAYAVSIAKEAAPKAKIGVHLHNTFGLGVALNLAAVQAGAEFIEVALNGYCGGPGQADTQHVVAALELLHHVDTGVKLDSLTSLRRLGEDLTRKKVSWNHPITGEETFDWGGADLLTLEGAVDPLIHWCFEPSIVGNNRAPLSVDRSSGPWTMHEKLLELGFDLQKSQVEQIAEIVHDELLLRKRSLSDEEVSSIARRVIEGETLSEPLTAYASARL